MDSVERPKQITIQYEGTRITANEGDTVASALYAAGRRIFSRSFKYHRPRGLFCVSGNCPNCLMTIDGVPNVRACVHPAREGTRVKHQNAWPSLETDFYSGIRFLGGFMPVGFYYKTFIHDPIKWKSVEKRIRRIAGLGSLEDELSSWRAHAQEPDAHGRTGFSKEHLLCDVLVIGGGPAGLTAALDVSEAGASVILVDEQPELGGHLRFSDEPVSLPEGLKERKYNGLLGFQFARQLASDARSRRNIKVLSEASAFGLYESNQVGVVQRTKLLKIRAKRVIVATGSNEFISVFRNNDLPGVFLGTGVQRLISLHGVKPGKRAVVVTNNDSGLRVAKTLRDAGVEVVAFADARTEPATDGATSVRSLNDSGVPVLASHVVLEAEGSNHLQSVVLTKIGADGTPLPGTEKRFSCDLLCLSNGFEPDLALLAQARLGIAYDDLLGAFVPSEKRDTIGYCGDITGIRDLGCTLAQARSAAVRANLGIGGDEGTGGSKTILSESQKLVDALESDYRRRVTNSGGVPRVVVSTVPASERNANGLVCICEDVPEKDIVQAVFEGFADIETLKRYSTMTMGPCEGKMCSVPGVALCARETMRSIPETGRTVVRAPYHPVSIGALAGLSLHPVRLTPMHYKHVELGATLMDMGEWKRPHTYTSTADEYDAVRNNVGIIDLSTLGRLDVRGKDAAALLDFVYTHWMSKLQPGKSRYGVLCDDAGVILDDGTVTRLEGDHFFVTTSTGNIDFVEQWMTWWATAKNFDVAVTNLTSGLAAVNIAGPKARDLLSKLTAVDLSTDKFPYMGAARGSVAGVPCIMLRIGFVGETGWEIHFPAEWGEYFWDTVLNAGKEYGIKPFGVETQRLLRLEKKHVIVGQDTDALSNPYEADMSWVVRLDKPDFVGKAALTIAKDRPSQRKLVGFVMEADVTPHDGDQAFSASGRNLIGTVTSCRLSPAVGKAVGLALVESSEAKEGGVIKITSGSVSNDARITFTPFYDPEGRRLKS